MMQRLRRLGPLLTVSTVTAVLGCRFFLLIAKYSVNVLRWDQWDYLGPFFAGNPPLLKLFQQQNGPHREGIGLLADKFLYPITQWNTRVDAFLIAGCIAGATILALLLKKRLFGAITYSDIAIPALGFTLAQCEKIVADPNPAYAGFPLLMIMLFCHALLQTSRFWKYASVLVLNFLLIYTGFGFFMGPVTLGVFFLEFYQSWRRSARSAMLASLAGMLIAALSLASFFVRYTFWPAVDCFKFPYHPIWHYPWFVAIMFSRFVIGTKSLPFATIVGVPVALAALALAGYRLVHLLRHETEPGMHWVSLVLLNYTLLFSIDCAIGRVCLGIPAAAQAARYVSLMIPAFLAIYFWLVSFRHGTTRTVALVIFVIVFLHASSSKPGLLRWYAVTKTAWSECYLRNENIPYCDQVSGVPLYPASGIGYASFESKLQFLKQHRLNFFSGPDQPKSK
jgi:hypothetical protein